MNDTQSIASIQRRLTSFVIDDLVIALLILVIFYDPLMQVASHLVAPMTPESIEIFKNEMHQFSVNNLPFILLLKVLYHTIFIWQNGMTLGKYIMKIKVLSLETDETLTFTKSLLRALLRIVSEILFYLGFVLALFLPLKQTLHDKLSQSIIVNV